MSSKLVIGYVKNSTDKRVPINEKATLLIQNNLLSSAHRLSNGGGTYLNEYDARNTEWEELETIWEGE